MRKSNQGLEIEYRSTNTERIRMGYCAFANCIEAVWASNCSSFGYSRAVGCIVLWLRYWLQFDTDMHDTTPKSNCAQASAGTRAEHIIGYIKDAQEELGLKIAGIHFDNEGVGGNLQAIVEAWAEFVVSSA